MACSTASLVYEIPSQVKEKDTSFGLSKNIWSSYHVNIHILSAFYSDFHPNELDLEVLLEFIPCQGKGLIFTVYISSIKLIIAYFVLEIINQCYLNNCLLLNSKLSGNKFFIHSLYSFIFFLNSSFSNFNYKI